MMRELVQAFEQHNVAILVCEGMAWFRAHDVTTALGYKKSSMATRQHVKPKYVRTLAELQGEASEPNALFHSIASERGGKHPLYISEPGVYELVFHSKKPDALRFQEWMVETVLPEIRRTGGYVRNKQVSLLCETDLHAKVVDFVRRFFSEAIMIAGLGELQDTQEKRIDAWRKGYTSGQPDLVLLNRTNDASGLALEFKTPLCQREASPQQHAFLQRLGDAKFKTIVSNCYDEIIVNIIEFREKARRYKPRKHPNKAPTSSVE